MDDLLVLGYTLTYRLDVMAMATCYKNILGLNYPDCASCSVEHWTYPFYESKQQDAKEKLAKCTMIRRMIHSAKIISAASVDQWYNYNKPVEYLAIALIESQKSEYEVTQSICILHDGKWLLLHQSSIEGL